MRQNEAERTEEEVYAPSEHLGQRLGAAFVRDVHGLYSGARTEALGAEMRCRADADGRIVQRSWLRLCGRDEVCGGVEAAARRNDENVRRYPDRHHGREASRRMVVDFRIERRRNRVRRSAREQ